MGKLVFYLDGAHSPESMEACAKWFSSATKEGKTLASLTPPSSFEVEHLELSYENGFIPHEKKPDSDVISKQVQFLLK